MKATCPYCRAGIEPGDASTDCPSCSATHHEECWTENAGCAVHGCGSSPRRPTASAAAPAAGAASPPPLAASPPPPLHVSLEADASAPEAGQPRRRRARTVVAVILLLFALVAAGGAVALVLTQQKTPVVADGADRTAPPTSVPTTATPTAATAAEPDDAGPTPAEDLSDAQVVRGARKVLTAHHRHLKNAQGLPQSPHAKRAYKLLSRDKREAETASAGGGSGFQFWINKNGAENLSIGLAVTLPPAEVTLEDWDPETGVAFVCADFGAYRGRTWVKYESGEWRYDAGYGHVPSRRAEYANSAAAAILFGRRGPANEC